MPAGTGSPAAHAALPRSAAGGDFRAQSATCTRLLNLLGILHYPGHALLQRAHGGLVVAERAPGILIDTVHFGENLRAMKETLAFGGALEPLVTDDIARVANVKDRPRPARMSWDHYLSKGYQAGILLADRNLAL